jgi:hypothetical protein
MRLEFENTPWINFGRNFHVTPFKHCSQGAWRTWWAFIQEAEKNVFSGLISERGALWRLEWRAATQMLSRLRRR